MITNNSTTWSTSNLAPETEPDVARWEASAPPPDYDTKLKQKFIDFPKKRAHHTKINAEHDIQSWPWSTTPNAIIFQHDEEDLIIKYSNNLWLQRE
jgi:hypothetical protein